MLFVVIFTVKQYRCIEVSFWVFHFQFNDGFTSDDVLNLIFRVENEDFNAIPDEQVCPYLICFICLYVYMFSVRYLLYCRCYLFVKCGSAWITLIPFMSLPSASPLLSSSLPSMSLWWWCRPHPVREHAQDLRPPLGARPASPPTRQAAQPPPRGPSTNPRPLV